MSLSWTGNGVAARRFRAAPRACIALNDPGWLLCPPSSVTSRVKS
ncbi:Uncharacterised protein [Mycobacteroides abscessus subsp. abscessus]|nr:Uncharacterised protein [Mycobacteroides abscessus subsp. abscessus]SKV58654.1 Uncharacterised protein [Mycobacteroides abscessus subsp. abscessus]